MQDGTGVPAQADPVKAGVKGVLGPYRTDALTGVLHRADVGEQYVL